MWVRSILDRVTAPSNRSATRAANRRNAARRLRMESLEERSLLAVVASDDVYAAVEDTPLVVAAPGVLDNDTDPNNDDLSAILVDNPGHGTLSLNSDGSFSYTPNVNFFGTDTFTYQASDGQADSNIAAVTINVSSVNDPPIGNNGTVTMAEDTLYTFQVADFNFIDPADFPPNSLAAVRITSLPAAGTLTVFGIPAGLGQVVPVSLIVSGQMRFVPAINASGLPYASFTFQVQDDGGTANGGVDLSPFPNTLTINVSPVNDRPFGANGTVTMDEDTLYSFKVADFGFMDPQDTPANSFLAVRITTLPAAGRLIVNGVPAVAGQFVPVSSILSNQMRFIPAINASGLPYTSFTFQVQDDGGTFDLAPFPSTLTINVTPVNDPPSFLKGADQTVAEDAGAQTVAGWATALSAGPSDESGQSFNFIVSSDNPGLFSTQPAITSPATAANEVQTITQNVNGPVTFSFNGISAISAVNLSTLTNPAQILANLSTIPALAGNLVVTGPSGGPWTVTFVNALASLNVSQIGVVASGGNATVTTIVQGRAASSGGTLTYTPAPNATGTALVTVRLRDSGGAANGGVDTSPPETFTINVTPVNDPPIGANGTVTMAEDTLYALSVADFGFIDLFDAPPNSFQAVRITSLPAAGTLTDNGFPLSPGQVVPVSMIASGQLRFIPGPNASGLPYASFAFQVQDNGGTANGGVDFDPSPNTLTINVTPVNDPPIGANGTVTMAEDTLYALSVADFGFIDLFDAPPNSFQAVRITSLPAAGTLTDNGFPLFPGQVVPVSMIVSGQLRFVPAINANGLPYASFTFQVQDDGGTADGGVDLDPVPNTLTINVTPVNDAPVAEDDSYSTSQGTPLTVPAAGVLENDSDVDGDSLSAALATGPSHGAVTLNPDGSFTYTPDSTFSGTDTFTYTVNDGNGGTDTATVSIDVAAAAPGSVVTITDSCLGGTALLITGTSGNDSIVVTPGPGGTLTVTVNGVIHSVAAPSGRVIAFGGDGGDDIQVAGGSPTPSGSTVMAEMTSSTLAMAAACSSAELAMMFCWAAAAAIS